MSAIDGCRTVVCSACGKSAYHGKPVCHLCGVPVTDYVWPKLPEYTAAQHAGGEAVAGAIRRVAG